MPETQNIEYKSSWHEEYLDWICGFANAQGGKIYIGKDDSGNVIGVPNWQKRNCLKMREIINFHAMFTT
jgi:ATP-dependent DNA helicase RecG